MRTHVPVRVLCGLLLSLWACTTDPGGGDMQAVEPGADAGADAQAQSEDAAPPSPDAAPPGCADVMCNAGASCDPDTGRCVGDCADFACGLGQSCEAREVRAECVADCTTVQCQQGERCDDSGSAATCVAACDDACGEGQRCAGTGDSAACEDRTCAQLDCQLPDVCQPAQDGKGGSLCVDTSCESDLGCDTAEHCYDDPTVGGYCVGDVCTPGASRCSADGGAVEECLPNGSAWTERFTCLNADCAENGGEASCPCTDDWDCPAFTECGVDRCEGTGVAPTCFVAVVPMENVLPALEFQWGTASGTDPEPVDNASSDEIADGHPFPQVTQVVSVPLVANLTDDNGDGLVNELDFPEIVFLTMCGGTFLDHGVLRAVHGGGFDTEGNPLAGKDYFASAFNCNPGDAADCEFDDPNDWLVWNEGEDGATDSLDAAYGATGCQGAKSELDSTSTLAIGNLDGDASGYPEIVAIAEDAHVIIYDSTGHLIARSEETVSENKSGAPLIANLDGEGLPEIVVGRNAWTLALEAGRLRFDKAFEGNTDAAGTTVIGPIACAADLDGDGRQEVIAGASVFDFPDPATCTDPPCEMDDRWTANVPNSEGYCAVADVWGNDPDNPPHPSTNPLDGVPEVVLVRNGLVYVLSAADGTIIDSASIPGVGGGPPNVDDFDGDGMPEVGTAGSTGYAVVDFQAPAPLDGMDAGCPAWPNNLEVEPLTGTFSLDRGPYAAPDPTVVGNDPRVLPTQASGNPVVCDSDAECNVGIDPQAFACNENTRRCVCLHNGWRRDTQDGSSKSTGSSVFDFNGDGAAEVIYNDECFFRVYDGVNGRLYSRIPSESRTRSEYPVVADLDNDGNAEIVFGASNESNQCNKYLTHFDTNPYSGKYNAGLEVWGEPSDLWVSARRIWNQHAYHITNVSEGGAIPLVETPSWDPSLRAERGFNSYRSNPPSRAGIAPDLQVVEVSVSATGGGCDELGSEIDIVARIRNAGDLRVGADVKVAFVGEWLGGEVQALTDTNDEPLVASLGTVLRPGGEVLVSVTYDSTNKVPAGLPTHVTAIVDPDDLERECDDAADGDNELREAVVAPQPSADLSLAIDDVTGSCPSKTIEFTVTNQGGTAASDIVVRFYAGNPAGGGAPLGMTTVAGPLNPGESVSDSFTTDFPPLAITPFGVVDPDGAIEECSENNNTAAADEVSCVIVIQ